LSNFRSRRPHNPLTAARGVFRMGFIVFKNALSPADSEGDYLNRTETKLHYHSFNKGDTGSSMDTDNNTGRDNNKDMDTRSKGLVAYGSSC